MKLNPRFFTNGQPTAELAEIAEATRRIFARESKGQSIKGVYLTGSQVEETGHPKSDLDIYVRTTIDKERIFKLRKELAESLNFHGDNDFADYPRPDFVDPCIGNCTPYGRVYNLETGAWEFYPLNDERFSEFLCNCPDL